MLSASKLPLRLLRAPTTSILAARRFAHEVAVPQSISNDPPPSTPSPYSKDFTNQLSESETLEAKRARRKETQKRKKEAKRLAREATAPKLVEDDKATTRKLLETVNKSTAARIEELRKSKSPMVAEGAHQRISARLERIRRGPLRSTKIVSRPRPPAGSTSGGGQFWKAGWGEDKLRPSISPESPEPADNVDIGPTTPLRVVKGIIPSLKVLDTQDLLPPTEQRPVARLAHGLDRALFNPGVSWIRDPRSRVYNFNPYIEEVPDVREFDFNRIAGFIKSSRDEDLHSLAKRHGARFAGSTSSLTGMLSQIYLALSRARDPDMSVLSEAFLYEQRSFAYTQTLPVSVVLWHRDGVYSTDSYSYSSMTDKNILTWMGTMLEKFLTLPEDEFTQLMRASPRVVEEEDGRKEAYRYAKVGSYVTRAQLDCYDPRVPGTGIFDIKTRACLPIRKDLMNWEENSGYLLKRSHGLLESFEREYYDLIRAAFLKFSFQARIGNMDGMFIAYHNTDRIFGFQYVPLEEMDERLYGRSDAGPLVFEKCMQLLEATMLEIIHHFPEQNIECIFEAVPADQKLLVWASPLNWKGNKEEKPIVELAVSLRNIVDGKHLQGDRVADQLPSAPWSVLYNIAQSSDNIAAIRKRADDALERQRLPWRLPEGVGVKQMAELWEAIDFGGGDVGASKAAFEPERFVKAGPTIKALRRIARRGREETERHEQLHAGEKKVVWGEPVPERDKPLSGDGGIPAFSKPRRPLLRQPEDNALEDVSPGSVLTQLAKLLLEAPDRPQPTSDRSSVHPGPDPTTPVDSHSENPVASSATSTAESSTGSPSEPPSGSDTKPPSNSE